MKTQQIMPKDVKTKLHIASEIMRAKVHSKKEARDVVLRLVPEAASLDPDRIQVYIHRLVLSGYLRPRYFSPLPQVAKPVPAESDEKGILAALDKLTAEMKALRTFIEKVWS